MGKPTFDNGILKLSLARGVSLDFRYQMKE